MMVECTDVENEAVSAALSQCMMVECTDTENEAVSAALSQCMRMERESIEV